MKAVAAGANAPNTIMLVVLKDGPVKTVDDLKGRVVSVSTTGSLTYWLTQQLSRAQGWGDEGIKISPLGGLAVADRRIADASDRRSHHRQRHGRTSSSRPAPAASWSSSATASRISTSM